MPLFHTQAPDAIIEAIRNRQVLQIVYQHKRDKQIIHHRIALFHIATTNPATAEQNKDNAYAYCYDHLTPNGSPDPKVVAFLINGFYETRSVGETFDLEDLARRHFQRIRIRLPQM